MFTEFFSRAESRLWWRSQLRFAVIAVALCAAAWWAAHSRAASVNSASVEAVS